MTPSYILMAMKDELLRHCIDLACTSGKNSQQQESGYVASDKGICLYDNFLFSLALLRSKMHENVFEAKRLLERLLFLQQNFPTVAWQGNFPVYLHEFPHCKEHTHAVRCLIILLWIYRDFHHILGQEMVGRLKTAITQLTVFCHQVASSFPYWAKVSFTACQHVSRSLFQEAAPAGPFPDFSDTSDLRIWGDVTALSEMIAAFNLYPEGPYAPFFDYLGKTWDAQSALYAGPVYCMRSQEPLLYDYCMGISHGKLSKKADMPQHAALICALAAPLPQLSSVEAVFTESCSTDQYCWNILQNPSWRMSTIIGNFRREEMTGVYPACLFADAHALYIQPQQGHLAAMPAPHEMIFEVPGEVFEVEKQKHEVLCFWTQAHKETEVTVAGLKASCFTLADALHIRLGSKRFCLSFSVLGGEKPAFLGHIRRGNRMGQTKRFGACDTEVVISAVRGKGPCQLKVSLNEIF